MLQNEDYARLKVREAIQDGLMGQRISRELNGSQREKGSAAGGARFLKVTFVFVALSLTLVVAAAVLNIL